MSFRQRLGFFENLARGIDNLGCKECAVPAQPPGPPAVDPRACTSSIAPPSQEGGGVSDDPPSSQEGGVGPDGHQTFGADDLGFICCTADIGSLCPVALVTAPPGVDRGGPAVDPKACAHVEAPNSDSSWVISEPVDVSDRDFDQPIIDNVLPQHLQDSIALCLYPRVCVLQPFLATMIIAKILEIKLNDLMYLLDPGHCPGYILEVICGSAARAAAATAARASGGLYPHELLASWTPRLPQDESDAESSCSARSADEI